MNTLSFCKRYFRVATLGLLFAGLLILSGCSQHTDEAQKNAESALQQLLSCTVEQAEAFDALLADTSLAADTGEGTGISSSTDDPLMDYFAEQYGGLLTDSCLAQAMSNRLMHQSILLAKEFNADIQPSSLEVTQRSEESDVYDFTAEMTSGADSSPVAYAYGVIGMEYTSDGWQASTITLTITRQ